MKNPFLRSRMVQMLLVTVAVVIAVRTSSRGLAAGGMLTAPAPLVGLAARESGQGPRRDTTFRDTTWADTVRRDTTGRDTIPKPKRPRPLRPRPGAH